MGLVVPQSNTELPYDPASPLLDKYPRETEMYFHQKRVQEGS